MLELWYTSMLLQCSVQFKYWGAAVPFWWCSRVGVEKMVLIAVLNYQALNAAATAAIREF